MSLFQNTDRLYLEQEGIQRELDEKNTWNFWIAFLFWVGIIVIFAFLGFNIFSYFGGVSIFLENIVDKIKNLFAPILKFLGITITETTKQTLSTSNKGFKGLLDSITNTSLSGLDKLEQNMKGISYIHQDKDEDKDEDKDKDKDEDKDKNKDLDKDKHKHEHEHQHEHQDKDKHQDEDKHQNEDKDQNEDKHQNKYTNIIKNNIKSNPISSHPKNTSLDKKLSAQNSSFISKLPVPFNSNSTLNLSKPNAKGQFCYIGQEKDVRSCVEIKDNNTACESNQLYSNKDICVNPTLRN